MIYILGSQTLITGIYTLFYTDTLYPNYLTFTQLLDDAWWGMLLIIIGLYVILAEWRKWKPRILGLTLLQLVWSFYFGVFLYEQVFGIPNTEWILTLGLVVTLFYVAWRGEADGR